MTLEQVEQEMVAQPVRSLQFMLRRLSQRYDFLPELQPDGRFGERTLEAVMLFQKHLHPPVTGVVDQDTWTAIRDHWLRMELETAPPRQLRGFPEKNYAHAGESGGYLYVTQAMFQSLSKMMEGLEQERIDGIQSGSSVDNAKWLQHRANLRETGDMDRQTWDMLSRLYELFVVRQPQGERPRAMVGRG